MPVSSVHKDAQGLTLKMQPGILRLRVFSPRTVEVTYAPGESIPDTKSLAVIARPARNRWTTDQTKDEITLRTDELSVRVNRATGTIAFYDKNGKLLLAEKADGGKSLTPNRVGTLDTLRSEQSFQFPSDEAVYGLGQHQQGLMNYHGERVHLQQTNPGESAVPVLVSSRGYGILWDNPAITDVDAGKASGDTLSWQSESADTIDYYFMSGPELDTVIADYRDLTGAAPMFGKWSWGFWQCRERYQTQQELLDVVAKYRGMHVPIDGIIQDWQYWSPAPWGSHEFNTNRYPDPTKLMQDIHAEHVHTLISVWPKFDKGSANFQELSDAGALYPILIKNKGRWYDPFNPKARKLYWDEISREIFTHGFDGWWLDASEPELSINWGEYHNYETTAGPATKVFNAYPLMHTTSVYEGQRKETSDKRVYILTRSAYAGQQRNAAVTWSGDIRGTWEVFQHQIPAGLNFSLSGIPYWNTDTGAFFAGDPADPKYAELFTRWFQFSAFCPMFRVHGTGKPKEMWRFAEPTEKILIQYDWLRYHLLPYIYSVSWQVTSQGGSMLRPLVMDFTGDANVYNIPDQFMFGPALMACPVTHEGATNREVYLPASAKWFDFWTGESVTAGKITAATPMETMPLYVRAGSIIPYGPAIEYAAQSVDPIELRIYRGANGQFTLYEDEGDNYNYEKGIHATIPFEWNEAEQTLTIGKRTGKFPGMLKERTFKIVWVSSNHGSGIETTATPDSIIQYRGHRVEVHPK